ncbi:VOC family protein [Pseudopedobacter beijingensis]|uniref:VOC family protein n=1 Tax=Pseudopedobacter beijingensis TaxID=1207056 RepID=A0ABW4IIK6_9SPHI
MEIQFKRLHHILLTVPVGKIQEARDFYANAVGLQEIEGQHPNGAIWFQMGDVELHLLEEDKGGLYSNHPAFEIKGLSAIREHFLTKGLELSYPPKIEGRERFFIRDPFGNRVEFIEFI